MTETVYASRAGNSIGRRPTARARAARRKSLSSQVAPDAARIEQALQAVDAVHRLAVERNDPVAGGDAGAGRGTSRRDVDHVHRAGARQIEMTHDARRDAHVRAGHADVSAAHPSMRKQLPDDPLRRVDAGREANGLRLAESWRY